MNEKVQNSRELRSQMTKQEQMLWQYLRKKQINNCRFRRQYPIGPYIVDFICLYKKLVIEIDGGQHNTQEAIDYDSARTSFLKSLGFNVIRFWNSDIDNNIESVFEIILKSLE